MKYGIHAHHHRSGNLHRQAVHSRVAVSGCAASRPARGRRNPGSDSQSLPYLEAGDIDEVLRYAAFLAEDETVELAPTD
jgi:hypothetical protein